MRSGSFVFGSIGSKLTASAYCPVAVARGAPRLWRSAGDVVAGVRDDAASQDVLACAFDFAGKHAAPLQVVPCPSAGHGVALG